MFPWWIALVALVIVLIVAIWHVVQMYTTDEDELDLYRSSFSWTVVDWKDGLIVVLLTALIGTSGIISALNPENMYVQIWAYICMTVYPITVMVWMATTVNRISEIVWGLVLMALVYIINWGVAASLAALIPTVGGIFLMIIVLVAPIICGAIAMIIGIMNYQRTEEER